MDGINWDVLIPFMIYFGLLYVIGFYSIKFVSKASQEVEKGF